MLGVLTLNQPKSLNALTREMFELMAGALHSWKTDDQIVGVILQSSSTRAFCAGGDIKSIAHAQLGGSLSAQDSQAIDEFFKLEYETDFQISDYPKPVLCWAEGITMGGGMGIMNGASHRVVTETTVLAMPEISIGFFPDVGAGFFLNLLSRELGHFLALTGARVQGGDAVFLKWADFYLMNSQKTALIQEIESQSWDLNSTQVNHQVLTDLLQKAAMKKDPENITSSALTELKQALHDLDLFQWGVLLKSWKANHPWIHASLNLAKKGAPLSAGVVFEYLKRCKNLTRKEVYALDWKISHHMCRGPNFKEGVRALLIDKTADPQWSPVLFKDVTDEEVLEYFSEF